MRGGKANLAVFGGLLLLLAPGPADAQGMPSPDKIRKEVRRRVREAVEAAPVIEATEGVLTLRYRAIPSNPERMIGEALPEGFTLPPALVSQFEPMVVEELNLGLADLGTLEATEAITLSKRKTEIPAGVWRLGFRCERFGASSTMGLDLVPRAMVLTEVLDEEAARKRKKPKVIQIPLGAAEMHETWAEALELAIDLPVRREGKEVDPTERGITVRFARVTVRTPRFRLPGVEPGN